MPSGHVDGSVDTEAPPHGTLSPSVRHGAECAWRPDGRGADKVRVAEETGYAACTGGVPALQVCPVRCGAGLNPSHIQ